MLISFTTKVFHVLDKELEKNESYLEEVFIGRVLRNNQKCIEDYFLEMKAEMNFIFLLLP